MREFTSILLPSSRWQPILTGAVLAGAALIPTTSGQELAQVFVLEGEQFVQTSAGAPAPAANNPFLFRALASGLKTAITAGPTIKSPAGAVHLLTGAAAADDPFFRFEESAATLAALGASYPSGQYTVSYTGQFSGAHSSQINLAPGVIPAAPVLANFAAAQNIDAENDFDLQWSVNGGAANDAIEVKIMNAAGDLVANSPALGLNALDGTTASFTIDGGTLQAGEPYTVTITFYKVIDRSFTSVPVPLSAYFAETKATIKAAGGGAQPGDTTPPALVEVQPARDSSYPVANFFTFPVAFVFSEEMTSTQSVQWSPNIDPAKVSYQWAADGGTRNKILLANYAGGWPASATISWELNPAAGGSSNFRDAAGNLLAAGAAKGSFFTGPGDSDSICEGSDALLGAGFGVLKVAHYEQSSSGAISLDTAKGASFSAFYDQAGLTDLPLVTVSDFAIHRLEPLDPPNNTTNLFRVYNETKANLGELDSAWPAGTYDFVQTYLSARATNKVTFAVGAGTYPPVPKFVNLPLGTNTDISQEFAISWTPLAAGADGLTVLEIFDPKGLLVFRAPDACAGRALPAGASSTVVPKRALRPDVDYTATLTFYKVTDQGKALPNIVGKGLAAIGQSTTVALKSKSDLQPTPNRLHEFLSATLSSGEMQFQFSAWAGSNYVLEAASSLKPPVQWTQVKSAHAATQLLKFSDPDWRRNGRRFYRMRLADALPVFVQDGLATLDTSRTVSQVSSMENGTELTLTASSGDIYTLRLPPEALYFAENISMTLVQDLKGFPLSGGFSGGLQFAPSDLLLAFNGTLTVQFATPPPATLAAVAYHRADGKFSLAPHLTQSNTVTVPIWHLGGIGIGKMTAADLGYFKTNSLASFIDKAVQGTALIAAQASVGAAPQFARLRAAQAPQTAQDFRAVFDGVIYPQLAAVSTGNNPTAMVDAFNAYIIWHREAFAADALLALGAEVDKANTLIKATLSSRTEEYLARAASHDYCAIRSLTNLRKAIQFEPWGRTWMPGEGQALLDRIYKAIKFRIILDSTTLYETLEGDVYSKVHAESDYQRINELPAPAGVNNSGPSGFLEHTHYQPPAPCSVTWALGGGSARVWEIQFYGQAPTYENPDVPCEVSDIGLVFWPDHLDEHDIVQCPETAVKLEYWFPAFGSFHQSLLKGFQPKASQPVPAFHFVRGWFVGATGDPQFGKLEFHNRVSTGEIWMNEDSKLIIRHTPE